MNIQVPTSITITPQLLWEKFEKSVNWPYSVFLFQNTWNTIHVPAYCTSQFNFMSSQLHSSSQIWTIKYTLRVVAICHFSTGMGPTGCTVGLRVPFNSPVILWVLSICWFFTGMDPLIVLLDCKYCSVLLLLVWSITRDIAWIIVKINDGPDQPEVP